MKKTPAWLIRLSVAAIMLLLLIGGSMLLFGTVVLFFNPFTWPLATTWVLGTVIGGTALGGSLLLLGILSFPVLMMAFSTYVEITNKHPIKPLAAPPGSENSSTPSTTFFPTNPTPNTTLAPDTVNKAAAALYAYVRSKEYKEENHEDPENKSGWRDDFLKLKTEDLDEIANNMHTLKTKYWSGEYAYTLKLEDAQKIFSSLQGAHTYFTPENEARKLWLAVQMLKELGWDFAQLVTHAQHEKTTQQSVQDALSNLQKAGATKCAKFLKTQLADDEEEETQTTEVAEAAFDVIEKTIRSLAPQSDKLNMQL